MQFDFWIADADTECPAKNVKVTWLYQIADKTTKVSVKTVLGSTTLPQVFQNTQLHSNGTQHLPQGRKRNDNPFLVGPKLQHQGQRERIDRAGRSLTCMSHGCWTSGGEFERLAAGLGLRVGSGEPVYGSSAEAPNFLSSRFMYLRKR